MSTQQFRPELRNLAGTTRVSLFCFGFCEESTEEAKDLFYCRTATPDERASGDQRVVMGDAQGSVALLVSVGHAGNNNYGGTTSLSKYYSGSDLSTAKRDILVVTQESGVTIGTTDKMDVRAGPLIITKATEGNPIFSSVNTSDHLEMYRFGMHRVLAREDYDAISKYILSGTGCGYSDVASGGLCDNPSKLNGARIVACSRIAEHFSKIEFMQKLDRVNSRFVKVEQSCESTKCAEILSKSSDFSCFSGGQVSALSQCPSDCLKAKVTDEQIKNAIGQAQAAVLLIDPSSLSSGQEASQVISSALAAITGAFSSTASALYPLMLPVAGAIAINIVSDEVLSERFAAIPGEIVNGLKNGIKNTSGFLYSMAKGMYDLSNKEKVV